MRAILILAGLLLASPALAESRAAEQPAWQVCFTPGQDCTRLIVQKIGAARRSILVQAYSFTSPPILAALKAPHHRGVDVKVIVDKSSARPRKSGAGYSAATYLSNAGVRVWVDVNVAIAHNKVMVIDSAMVITSSFNFTVAAQSHNAENLVVIEDRALAAKYRENWEARRAVSLPYGAQAEIPGVEDAQKGLARAEPSDSPQPTPRAQRQSALCKAWCCRISACSSDLSL